MTPESNRLPTDWLEQTRARLLDGIAEDRLALGPGLLGGDAVEAVELLFSTLEVPQITFSAPSVTLDDDTLAIRGTVALYGLKGLDCTLSLGEDEERNATLSVRVVLDDSAVPSFPGTSFSVRDVGIALEVEGSPAAVVGGIEGTIAFGEVELPIALSGGSQGWTARGDFARADLPGPTDLLALAGGEALLSAVPGELLDGVRALALTKLEIGFDPDTVTLSFVSLAVAVSEDWELLPDRLALRDLELVVSVMRRPSRVQPVIVGRIEGALELAGSVLPLAVEVSGATGDVRLWLNTTERIPLPGLSDLATLIGMDPSSVLPAELDATTGVWISELDLVLDLAHKRVPHLSFAFGLERGWTLVPELLSIEDIEVELTVAAPAGGSDPTVTGAVRGSVEIAGIGIALSGELEEHLLLAGSIERLDLSRVAEALLGGAALPGELPEVRFRDVQVRVTPATGALELRGSAQVEWDLGGGPVAAEVDLALDRAGEGGAVDCTLALKAHGPVELVDGVILEALSLDFALEQGASWLVSGELGAVLFDRKLELGAGYEEVAGVRTLRLASSFATPFELLDLEGLGSLHIDSLALDLTERASGTDAPRNASARDFALSASGRIEVADVVDCAGSLRIHRGADGAAGLVFTPVAATAQFPLPVPGHAVSLALDFGAVSILRAARTNGGASAGWRLAATTSLAVRGLPPALDGLLPDVVNAALSVGDGQVLLTADRILEPLELDLPDVEVGAARIALGRARLDASNLSVRLGGVTELSADLGLGLPAELNNLFGVGEDGRPTLELFRTYDPARPDDTLVKLRLAVGSNGLSLTPTTSPLEAIQLVEEDGRSWCHCDLGACGELRLQVPVLSLQGGRLTASGGLEVMRPLSLPLAPLKLLLAGTAAAEALPDVLPLAGVDMIDAEGHLRVDELLKVLESVGAELTDELREGIARIGERLDRLPASFKQYLDVEAPKSFHFDISVASGSVRLDVGVDEGDPPIRLLLPGMVGPLPGLNGIELRNIAFGPLLGGALFLLEVDARVDQFDIVTLAASLLLPEDGNLPLPDTHVLERRIVIDKLFLIIVYQTGIPVPVPLFYDQLGIEYLGLEGVLLQAHASFPMPTLDLGEATQLLSGFKQFFTDRDFLLDTEAAPEGMNLALTLGANYVQLPSYLGGRLLGSRQEVGTIDAYSSLARFLNGLKTFELDPLIRSIPIARRVGTSGIEFGPLAFDVAWAITTPDEFMGETFRYVDLSPDEREAALAILPGPGALKGGESPTGVVIFLKGGAEIAGVASFDVRFGLLATSGSGFATGVRVAGSLAGALQLELAGNVYIDPSLSSHESAFGLDASGRLLVGGREVLAGSAALEQSSITLAGAIDLFPDGQPLTVKGDVLLRLSSRDSLLEGRVDVQVLGLAADADLRITERGLRLSLEGKVFGAFDCALTIQGGDLADSGGLAVSARMRNDLLEYLRSEATRSIQSAATGATAVIDRARGMVAAAQDELAAFDAQIGALRKKIQAERDANRKELTKAEAVVTSAQKNLSQIQAQINSAKSRISALKGQLNSKYRWYTGQPWHRQGWALAVYAQYAGPRNAEIAATNVKIAGLETAKWAATGALELAKGALALVLSSMDVFPIEADARMRILTGARAAAELALDAARVALEGVRAGVGTVADVADFIGQVGLGGVLDLREARFDAVLGAAAGGKVTLMLELSFMGGPLRTIAISIDFHDPLLAAQSVAKALLPG